MSNRLNKFLHDENIRNLEQKIEIETDPARAATLRSRLLEERSHHPLPEAAAEPEYLVP